MAKDHGPEPNPSSSISPFTTSAVTVPEQTQEDYFCGVCGGQYLEETDDVEKWIACDDCDSWSHWTCVGLSEEPDNYFCPSCVDKSN